MQGCHVSLTDLQCCPISLTDLQCICQCCLFTYRRRRQIFRFCILCIVHRPQSKVHSPKSTVHCPLSTVHSPQSTVHCVYSVVCCVSLSQRRFCFLTPAATHMSQCVSEPLSGCVCERVCLCACACACVFVQISLHTCGRK